MKRKALLLGVSLALLLIVEGMAFAANPYLHYFDCKNCHFANATMASMSTDHICLKCHVGASVTAPNDKLVAPLATALDPTGAADGKPGMINWKAPSTFSTGDASNKFGHNPAPGAQTSHNWAASNLQSVAGAAEPTGTGTTGFYSRYGASTGKVTCSRCHNPHGEAVIDANADYNPVTRTGIDNPLGNPKLLIGDSSNANKPMDPEKLCRSCHAVFASQDAGNHGLVGHPVTSDTYANVISTQSSKYKTEAEVNAAADASAPELIGGKVTCLSCHGVHFTDSDKNTADGVGQTLNSGDGNLLKGDGKQFVNDPVRSTTFCNTCHQYAAGFHGTGVNAIGCMGCHGGHNNTSSTPSYYMLNSNYTSLPTTSQEKSNLWGGTQDGVVDGFCETCHGDITLAPFNTVRTHTSGEDCTQCHLSHADGAFSQPIGCDGCHGSPPQVDAPGNTLAGGTYVLNGYAWAPSGSATASQYDYKASSGHYKNEATTPHTSHSGTSSRYSFQCKVCHNTHIDDFAGTHNKNSTSFRDVLEAGHPYDSKAVAAGAANPAYDDGNPTGNCSNVYCHSNGGVNNGTGTRTFGFTTAPWAAGGKNSIVGTANECGNCHGNDATDMAAGQKNNSAAHVKHLNAGFSCDTCHTSTAASATAFQGAGIPATHLNQAIDVAFTTGVLKTGGAAATFPAGSFNGSTDTTCDTVYCHSNGNLNAGQIVYRSINWATGPTNLACTACHNIPGAVGDKQTAAHAAHVNGATSKVGRNLDCGVCHADTATNATTLVAGANSATGAHVNGTVNVKMNFAGIDLLTCSNISCHSDGNFEVGATTTFKNAVWTSTTGLACDSCHGSVVADGKASPDYANGGVGVNANSHNKHVGGGIACGECHAQTSTAGTALDGSDKTKHVNRTVEVSGTKITSYTDGSETCAAAACHGAGSPQWGGAIASCRECHSSASTDVDSFTFNGTVATIALDEWTYSGHGKSSAANYEVTGRAGAGLDTAAGTGDGCLYCHDGSINHNDVNYFRLRDNGFADLNGACLGCHATGSTGVDPDGGAGAVYANKNAAVKIDKYHAGAKHADPRDAGTWCWDCHDPHGDADVPSLRIQMVQRNPQVNPNANGVPTGVTTGDVIFTDRTIGAGVGGFARASGTYTEGICNNCHTTTAQYTQVLGDNGHPTGQCTVCHKHSENTTYNGEAFKGAGCSGCHGDAATDRYWPDGSGVHPDDNAGRHQKHMEVLAAKLGYTLATANDAQQKQMCAYCHDGPGVTNHANGVVNVNSMYKLWDATADDGVFDTAGDGGNGTCATVDCHNNKTTPTGYSWDGATLSACIMCHSDVTAEATHTSHVSAAGSYGRTIACADCHDSTTSWATNTKPASNHINGTFNVGGTVTLSYTGTYPSAKGTCGTNECHNNGRNGTPANNGYAWGTNDNTGGCDYCHALPPGLAHTPHFASTGTFVSNFATLGGGLGCNVCHTHSGINAAHINKTITIAAGMGYTGSNLGYNQAPAYGACSTTTCHNNGKGTAVATPAWNAAWAGEACDLCHFNGSAAKTASGVHGTHIGAAGQNSYTAAANASTAANYIFNCGKCHGGALATHLNSATWATPTIDVAAAVSYNAGTDTCVNNACHNNGNGAGAGNDANLTANWTTGWVNDLDSDKCNNCHGNSPTSNAHRAHAVGIHAEDIYSGTTGKLSTVTAVKSHGDAATSATISCNVCHSGTVTSARNKFGTECTGCHNGDAAGTVLAVADKSKHVDDGTAKAEVTFADMTAFKSKAQLRDNLADANDGTTILSSIWNRLTGYKAAATDHDEVKVAFATPTFAAGNCSNVACHNNNTAIWNERGNIDPATYAPNCMTCHTSLPK